ncbi:MAG TPA: hypothetical protein VMW28_03535 [Pelolinea sp.]|nr:hypothetical protein [Pelolinea sp.]
MKILVIEPAEPDQSWTEKTCQVVSILKKLGYAVFKAAANGMLYEKVIREKPDVVFNLAGNDNETARRIPAILEIADVRYTGSCMMALSFNRFYNLMFPLLADSGIPTAPFVVMKAGQTIPVDHLHYPLTLFREGLCSGQNLDTLADLRSALKSIPIHDEVIVFGYMKGEREHLYLLDGAPIMTAGNRLCLKPALKAYDVMEARGLARFDFMRSDEVLLSGVDMSPHPLDDDLMKDAAESGWDEGKLVQYLVEHAGRD